MKCSENRVSVAAAARPPKLLDAFRYAHDRTDETLDEFRYASFRNASPKTEPYAAVFKNSLKRSAREGLCSFATALASI
ncbi:hypothetical protein GCM10023156_16230 [Novipirellula rosea]|uniref:Uncharacterized protein n=1 Tax=Novipirellula rosea TaxID=1031540 RepID=A0ABP8MIS5_9BACT